MSERTGVRAYLLDSGSGNLTAVTSPVLAQAAVDLVKFQAVMQAMSSDGEAQALQETLGTTVGGVMVAKRPVDFALFAYAATVDTYHRRAITAKGLDICGRSWQIVSKSGSTSKAGAIARVTQFFQRAFGKRTFSEGMTALWSDYDALANAYLEVVPNANGEPVELRLIPATQMWVRMDELGYVQQLGGQVQHFRDYSLDPKKYAALDAKDPLRDDARHGLIHWSQYSSWSPYYGIPPIMPAWSAVTLRALSSEYNLRFFTNGAIGDWAVIVEGDEISTATEQTIADYFRVHVKGVANAHKTLVLNPPAGGKVTFQKLTSDTVKDGAFPLLRKDCRDEILHAHGVPPLKAGIVEAGKLGGNLSSQENISYKEGIVDPGRQTITARLNLIIERGFGDADLALEFEAYDVEDVKLTADVLAIEAQNRVITPNEWRKKVHPDWEPLPGGDEPLSGQPSAADLLGLDTQMADLQQAVRKLVGA